MPPLSPVEPRHAERLRRRGCFLWSRRRAWKRSVDAEIRKSAGYRTRQTAAYAPLPTSSEPATEDKTELIELEEPQADRLPGRVFRGSSFADFVNAVSGKAKP